MSSKYSEAGGKVIDLAERDPRRKAAKSRLRRRILPGLLVLVMLGIAVLKMLTYTNYTRISERTHTDGVSGSYTAFGDGFVRYTSNGIQYINRSQKVVWETAYEMKNPATAVCADRTIAAADMKGNQIYLFSRKGFLGNISTTMPIQAFAVSEQGVAAVIVRSEDQTKLILYSPDGEILVEGRVSFTETGYPLALAISPNGEKVMVSYVSAQDVISSRVVLYNFADVNAAEDERVMLDETYPECVIPEVSFTDNDNCYAVGNGRLLFYGGSGKMKVRSEVEVEEPIKSVISDGKRIGIVTTRSEGEEKYALGIYSTSGRKLRFMNFDDEYNTIYMKKGRVFMLQGSHCVIYSTGGQRKFDGEFDTAVSYMVPVWGINRYLVAEEGRVEIIRLRK